MISFPWHRAHLALLCSVPDAYPLVPAWAQALGILKSDPTRGGCFSAATTCVRYPTGGGAPSVVPLSQLRPGDVVQVGGIMPGCSRSSRSMSGASFPSFSKAISHHHPFCTVFGPLRGQHMFSVHMPNLQVHAIDVVVHAWLLQASTAGNMPHHLMQ